MEPSCQTKTEHAISVARLERPQKAVHQLNKFYERYSNRLR